MNNDIKEQRRHVKRHGASSVLYFTKEHEDKIILYNSLQQSKEKEKIFEEYIYPVFIKIVDNLVNVYSLGSLHNIEEVKNDCVSFMSESIGLFNPDYGYKAFSFFSVIAKNWLLQYAKKDKKNRIFCSLSEFITEQDVCLEDENKFLEQIEESKEEYLVNIMKDFTTYLEKHLRKNTNLYKVFVGLSVFLSSYKNYSIASYNRKAMINFISEYTSLDKKRVSIALYRLKKNYKQYCGK